MTSEPVLDFWVFLKMFSVIQCLFFVILLATSKNENPKAQKFIVLFLLAFALLETDEVFFIPGTFSKFPGGQVLLIPWPVVWAH